MERAFCGPCVKGKETGRKNQIRALGKLLEETEDVLVQEQNEKNQLSTIVSKTEKRVEKVRKRKFCFFFSKMALTTLTTFWPPLSAGKSSQKADYILTTYTKN